MTKKIAFEGSYTAKTKASVERLWEVWTDVNKWHEWDGGVARAEIKDDFRAGKSFSLSPQPGDKTFEVKLKTVTKEKEFSDETALPFGVIKGTHQIETDGNLRRVTVGLRAEVDAHVSEMFGKEIWPDMNGGLPDAIDSMIKRAEQR